MAEEANGSIGSETETALIDVTEKTEGEDRSPSMMDVFGSDTREETSISALKHALHLEMEEEKLRQEQEESGKVLIAEPEEKQEAEDSEEEDEADTEDKKDEKANKETEETKKATVLAEAGEKKFKDKEISFLSGDKSLKVPNDAIIEVPVDGGIKKLYLQEVINRASGDMAVEARINKVQALRAQEEKLWKERQLQISKANEAVEAERKARNDLLNALHAGRLEDLFLYAAKYQKKDIMEVIQKFELDTMQQAEKFANMTESEKSAYFQSLGLKAQQALLAEERQKLDTIKQKELDAQTAREVEDYAASLMQEYDIRKEDFVRIAKTLKEQKIEFQSESPKDRVREVLNYVHEDRIFEAAHNIDPNLIKDTNFLRQVYKVTLSLSEDKPHFRTKESIDKVLRSMLVDSNKVEEQRIAENLSRKATKKGGKPERAKEASVIDDEGPLTLRDYNKKRYQFWTNT